MDYRNKREKSLEQSAKIIFYAVVCMFLLVIVQVFLIDKI